MAKLRQRPMSSLLLSASMAAAGGAVAPGPDALCAVLPRPELHVRLVTEPGVPSGLGGEVAAVVRRLWQIEGLALTLAPADSSPPPLNDGEFRLRITMRPITAGEPQPEPALGVVHFTGDLPHPDVTVSFGAVLDWVRRERDRRFRVLFFGTSRQQSLEFGGFDALARRAVAIAAAHEVGHFVLGTKAHDRGGLMRRDLALRAAEGFEPRDLALSAVSRARLRDRLQQAATCGSGGA